MTRTTLRSVWRTMVCLAFAMPVLAGPVPPFVNYQGRLTNANGQALGTGEYWLKFRVLDAVTGGNVIWGPFDFDVPAGGTITDGHRFKVSVVQGYFNVMLGDRDSAIPTSRSVLDAFNGKDRFVEITVVRGPGDTTENTTPLSPRQQVLAAPFAARALIAGRVGDYKYSARANDHDGWLVCDGRTVSRAAYPELFLFISTSFGPGDGSNATFSLPDLRGRVAGGIGQGQNPTLTSRAMGLKVGEETHTLTIAEMPSHSHTMGYGPRAADGSAPVFLSWDDASGTLPPWSSGSQGGGQPSNVVQPTTFGGSYFILADHP